MAYYVTAAAAAVLAAVVVTLTAALFAGGEACDNVVSMTSSAACQQTEKWESLCQQTLQNSPDTAEVTVYALASATLAKERFDDTLVQLDPMLGAGNLPTDERLAVDNCKDKYRVALSRATSVADQLVSCVFSLARQELIDAQAAVRSCQEGLQPYQFLQMYDKVTQDFDSAMVAYLLGAIVVGK